MKSTPEQSAKRRELKSRLPVRTIEQLVRAVTAALIQASTALRGAGAG